jgi:DNA end-binding protein Ku
MARAIWKGSISFGLVQIPVALHTAEQRDELSLTLLDRHDLGPVGYERVNRRTGEKVEWKDIVKGYPYRKGKYVVVSDEDIRKANVRATGTIDIQAFVEKEEISPLYYDTPYYLAPAKHGEKAYAVLRETLRAEGKVGIAKIVIRTRQHLAALRVEDELFVLQLLRFAHELRSPDDLEVSEADAKPAKPTPRELAMAKQLVSSMEEKWDPAQYHDAYRDDLLARIRRKAKEGEIEDAPASEERGAPPATNVVDLVELLKKSMEKSGHAAGTSAGRPSRRKHKGDARHGAAAHHRKGARGHRAAS